MTLFDPLEDAESARLMAAGCTRAGRHCVEMWTLPSGAMVSRQEALAWLERSVAEDRPKPC